MGNHDNRASVLLVISHKHPQRIMTALTDWSSSSVGALQELLGLIETHARLHEVPSMPHPREFMEALIPDNRDCSLIMDRKLHVLASVFPSYDGFNGEYAVINPDNSLVDRFEWGEVPPSLDLDYVCAQESLVLADQTTAEILVDRARNEVIRQHLMQLVAQSDCDIAAAYQRPDTDVPVLKCIA